MVQIGRRNSGGLGPGDGRDKACWITFHGEVAAPQETLDWVEKSGGGVEMGLSDVPGIPTVSQFRDPEGP